MPNLECETAPIDAPIGVFSMCSDRAWGQSKIQSVFNHLSPKLAKNYIYDVCAIPFGKIANLKPLFFTYYTNLRCNFNCSYCGFAREGITRNHHDELGTESVVKLLEILRREVPAIAFTGGEPTLRNDIVEILRAAKEMGFKTIGITTNMSLMHQKIEILDNVTSFVGSFDMTSEEEYSKMLGVSSKIVYQVKQNIIDCAKMQKEKGFHMTVNCVVTPQTIPQARKVMNFCFEHGVRFALVPAELEGGVVDENLKNSNDYRQLINDVIKAKKTGKSVFGLKSSLETIRDFKSFRCLPTLTPHVYPNGDLFYPCEPLQQVGANLLEVGDYKTALQMGVDKFGDLPKCKDRCHKVCYIETATLIENPWSIGKVLEYL